MAAVLTQPVAHHTQRGLDVRACTNTPARPGLAWLAFAVVACTWACGEDAQPTPASALTEHVRVPAAREAAAVAPRTLRVAAPPTRSPRHIDPATGTIAFESLREAVVPTAGGVRITQRPHIWTMNADGSEQRQMLTIPAHSTDPAWRPDSRKLAYARGATVYTVDADGQNTQRVSDEYVGLRSLSWAPDGRMIAGYTSAGNGSAIAILDTVTRLLRPLTDGDDSHLWPAWSPTEAVVTCQASEPEGSWVRAVHPVTGSPVNIEASIPGAWSAWSPGGEWLAVTSSDNSGGVIDIWDASWQNRRRLSGGRGISGRAAWSPGGSHIAFTRWSYGSYDIGRSS